ncbi:uncharacterized protein LOC117341935 [Pecten maximus]|uniref:uncharacterized protein LOC117341935 n=1 Tax=Pecten maximus TaxID=6579 RepID=UPI0014587727|nr:uncharacterized protein LOC117341935 [Pecten maximus]
METRCAPPVIGLVTLGLFVISVLFLIVMSTLVKEKLKCFTEEEYIPPLIPAVKEVEDLPVIVSAAHAHNFDQSMIMLQTVLVNLTRQHPSIYVIFYDIGLTETQNDTLYSWSKDVAMEIRRFPFFEYPAQLQRIESGALKPIILDLVLVEYDFVMWVGSSLRFNSDGSLNILFDLARSAKSGIIVLDSRELLKSKATKDIVTQSVRDEPIFYEYTRELNTDWLLINRRTGVMETVISPWMKCAVKRKCFFSKQTISAHPCGDFDKKGRYSVGDRTS